MTSGPGTRWGSAAVVLALLVGAGCSGDDPEQGAGDGGTEPGVVQVQDTSGVEGDAGDDDGAGSASEGDGSGDASDGGGAFEQIPDLVEEVIGSVLAVQTGTGEGSGVMFDERVAVTNAHVVGSARRVQVVTSAGEVLDAEVVGTDPFTDLAVLQLAEGGVPPLEFADELPRVGSLAVAIGNPLGFENTVSAGVVSGLERTVPGGGPALVGLLQTDAAISPGNSGGALIGADGRVIGINVAYIPPNTAGAVSIGFAIPAPVVIDVVEQLLAGEQPEHPFVGIQPVDLTATAANQLGLEDPTGVLVLGVVDGGPADQAGVLPGDVIVALDGDEVPGVSEFLRALRDYAPGDEVVATVQRDGREVDVALTLASRPPQG